jgi:hypothetical protein
MINIFSFIKSITYDKKPWKDFNKEEQKEFIPYMCHRILSMNHEYINIVNLVQNYILNPEQIYNIYLELIPKKQIWNKYIKNTSKSNKKLNEILSIYFKCSQREIQENINQEILNKDNINLILSDLGKSKQEIKEIWKK